MSIYKTLCVLVSFPENFTPRDDFLIFCTFLLLFPENFTPRDAHCCCQWASNSTPKDDFFIFCTFLFFFLKISLLEMLIAVGNEHLKTSPQFSPECAPRMCTRMFTTKFTRMCTMVGPCLPSAQFCWIALSTVATLPLRWNKLWNVLKTELLTPNILVPSLITAFHGWK